MGRSFWLCFHYEALITNLKIKWRSDCINGHVILTAKINIYQYKMSEFINQSWGEGGENSSILKHWYTVKSLEFLVVQFSWYSWVPLPHEFTSSRKTNLERVNFLTETENRHIHEITSQRISKKPKIHENWSPRN